MLAGGIFQCVLINPTDILTTGAIAALVGASDALVIGSAISIGVLVFVFVVWGAVLRARF